MAALQRLAVRAVCSPKNTTTRSSSGNGYYIPSCWLAGHCTASRSRLLLETAPLRFYGRRRDVSPERSAGRWSRDATRRVAKLHFYNRSALRDHGIDDGIGLGGGVRMMGGLHRLFPRHVVTTCAAGIRTASQSTQFHPA